MKLIFVADQADFIDTFESDDRVAFGDSNPDGSIADGYIAPVHDMRINGMLLDEIFELYQWVAVLKKDG
jgi:hypothetical protein